MKKRIVIILIFIGASIGLLVTSVPIAIAIRSARMGQEVERELKAIKAKGDPIRTSYFSHPPIPSSENAAVIYRKAFNALQLSDEETEYITSIYDAQVNLKDPSIAARANSILQRNEKAIQLLQQAARIPKCDFGVDWKKGISGISW